MAGIIQQSIRQQRPFATLGGEVFVGLQLVADRIMAPWSRHLKERADLTHVQYNVLRILRGAGAEGIWAGDIGERLITRSPDVTRIVDRLEARGLVRRQRDPADRRVVRVYITEEGRQRIAPFDDEMRELPDTVFGGLTREELEGLRDALEKILTVVE